MNREITISPEKVDKLRAFLIENIFRNPQYMFDDNIRGLEGEGLNYLDLISVICDMYEYIHILTFNKPYDYMFHWANKCGSWVETGEFDEIIERKMSYEKK